MEQKNQRCSYSQEEVITESKKNNQKEEIKRLELKQLVAFKSHPYKVEVNTELFELMKSIEKEEKRFADLTDYMEQMISSYRENGNVARALKDCEDTFEEGSMMKKLLQKAIHVRITGE